MSRQLKKGVLFVCGLFIVTASVIVLFILPFEFVPYYILHFIIIAGFTCMSVAMIMHAKDNRDRQELRYKVLKMVGYALFFIAAAFFGIVLFTMILVFFIWKI